MRHRIYDKDGRFKCNVQSLEFNGKWMGECFVNVTIKSASPIPFSLGDYIDYRGTRYTLNYEPSVEKNSSIGSTGNAFVYNDIKFNSPSDELIRCRFLDFVADDGSNTGANTIHYSNSPKFSFFCEDIKTLVEKIQVNLDRLYNNWVVELSDSEFESAHNLTIDVDNISVWEAMEFISTKFKTSFVVFQRKDLNGQITNVIRIGEELLIDHSVLEYGKGKGLVKIERTTDSSQMLINRLRAYGSEKNLPTRYYTNAYDPWYKLPLLHGKYADKVVTYGINNAKELHIAINTDFNVRVVFGNNTLSAYSGILRINYYDEKNTFDGYLKVDVNSQADGLSLVDKYEDARIISGLTMQDMMYNKECWIATVPLAPNNMSIKNLMLPSFLDYIGEKNGAQYILPKNETTTTKDDNGNVISLRYKGEDYTPVYMLDESGNKVTDSEGKWMLMLNFDPYVENSESIAKYGVREGCVFFDQEDESSETPEIYPTIQNVTAEEATDAGYKVTLPPNDNGNLDEILFGTEAGGDYEIKDDGVPDNEENTEDENKIKQGDFYIEIKDIGFDIKQYLSDSNAILKMNNGICGGYEFELVDSDANPQRINHNGYYGWKVWLKRAFDEGLGIYFPNKDAEIKAGDEFVLLNIDLPRMYVDTASQKLQKAAEEYLEKNSVTKPTFVPTLDRIKMARDLEENGEDSLHYKLKEGSILRFKDADLGIDVSLEGKKLFIGDIVIREEPDKLPEYDIKLVEEKEFSTIQKLQNEIKVIKSGEYSGISSTQAKNIATSVGDSRYLSKKKNDTAEGVITFEQAIRAKQGIKSEDYESGGNGFGVEKRGEDWHIEADHLHIRKKISAKEVEIQETTHIGGEQLLTAASCIAEQVDSSLDGYKVFFRRVDGEGNIINNKWKAGDQAYCNTFNLVSDAAGNVGNHYYWRLVIQTGIGGIDKQGNDMSEYHWIVLSATDCDEGSDIPLQGDKIVQLGNRNGESSRVNAIILAGAGEDSPYIRQYTDITTFSLGDVDTQIKPNDNKFKGYVAIEGGTGAENLADLPIAVQKAAKVGGENLLRNTGFDGDYESQRMEDFGEINAEDVTYNPLMEFWGKMGNGGYSVEDNNSVSGRSCEFAAVNDGITQEVELIKDEHYIVTFKSIGRIIVFYGDKSISLGQTGESKSQFDFIATGKTTFRFIGATAGAKVWEIKLERGTIATDWCPAREDSDRMADNFKELWYLQHAIKGGKTEILNGLILSTLIELGMYRNGVMEQVTAGISGILEDENTDVAFWGGGTLAQAINAVAKYKTDPTYQPTEEELSEMAKVVFTHGGRGILNDVILRGYVYALGGRFKGRVEAEEGYFKGRVEANEGVFKGEVHADKGYFLGSTRNVMVDITPDNYTQYLTEKSAAEGSYYVLDFDKTGYCIRFSGNFSNDIGGAGVLDLNLPILYKNDGQTEEEKDKVRAMPLQRVLIYNNADNLNLYVMAMTFTNGMPNKAKYQLAKDTFGRFIGEIGYINSTIENYKGEAIIWSVQGSVNEIEA